MLQSLQVLLSLSKELSIIKKLEEVSNYLLLVYLLWSADKRYLLTSLTYYVC